MIKIIDSSFGLRIVKEVSVLHCSVSCALGCLVSDFPRVEISVVVYTHSAVTDDHEEETAEKEEDAEGPSKERCPVSNEESSGDENVEVPSASSRLEEEEVILHELEVAE